MQRIQNWIAGKARPPIESKWLEKFNPHTGEVLTEVADSAAADVAEAVDAAVAAFGAWSAETPVRRGQVLGACARRMRDQVSELANCVARETGKPPRDANGEVLGAIQLAEFFAGEGMRLHGRSLTSGTPHKYSYTVRQPRGVCGLIVPANTPIANIAWKLFPALVCGNTVVLKASEDAPWVAQLMAEISRDSGVPDGVVNVIQGRGRPAGAALVEDARVDVISFTGSTTVGRWIAETAGKRLARVSLELGGKNPFVVCDDADLDQAVHWAILSAFSNAGQRCAAGSRIILCGGIHDAFVEAFVARARTLKLGVAEDCDLGPVVNRAHQRSVLAMIEQARASGARILCGGRAPAALDLAAGYYVEPTVVADLPPDAPLGYREVFGPVCTLHRVGGVEQALEVANASEYGLTSSIHTRNADRALWFAHRVRAGVANVNLGTFGSEPHMPFGGFGASGNGTREPGVEALDVYSELKNVSVLVRPALL